MAFSDIITLIFISERHLVLEHPITVKRRLAGRSTISTRTAIDTVHEVLNIITLFNPMRLFLPISVFSFLAGVIWGIPIVLQGRGSQHGGHVGDLHRDDLFLPGSHRRTAGLDPKEQDSLNLQRGRIPENTPRPIGESESAVKGRESGILPLAPDDTEQVEAIAAMHAELLPRSTPVRLGRRFLTGFYFTKTCRGRVALLRSLLP